MLDETIDIDSGTRREHILRPHEDVLDECRGHNSQGNLAVDAAEGEIVDFVSEGWNVGALGGVDIDGEYVFSVEIEVRVSSNENGVYPPLYSPSLVPLIQTVDAVITPSKSTKTRFPFASGGSLKRRR